MPINVEDLNLTEGFAGQKISQLLNRLGRIEETKVNFRNLRMRGGNFRKGMEKLGRLTLSKLYLQGKTSVDVDVSEYVLDKMREDQRQATDKIKKCSQLTQSLNLRLVTLETSTYQKKEWPIHWKGIRSTVAMEKYRERRQN